MTEIEIGSDNIVKLERLAFQESGVVINDATVTWRLTTMSGDLLANGSMDYVASSQGDYEGLITATTTAALVCHRKYRVEITAVKSSSTMLKRLVPTARYGEAPT